MTPLKLILLLVGLLSFSPHTDLRAEEGGEATTEAPSTESIPESTPEPNPQTSEYIENQEINPSNETSETGSLDSNTDTQSLYEQAEEEPLYSAEEDKKKAAENAIPAPLDIPEPKTMKGKLLWKFGIRGEKATNILIVTVDAGSQGLGKPIADTVEELIKGYGITTIHQENYSLYALTLEEFRKAMARYQADVIIIPSIKPTHLTLYIYDRADPYHLYSHTETVSGDQQLQLDVPTAVEMGKVLTRKTLVNYLVGNGFKLPEKDSIAVLRSDIPEFVSAEEQIRQAVRETTSRFYFALSMGGITSTGPSGQVWNTSSVGFEVGLRVAGKLFLNFSADTFSYNSLMPSVRYLFTTPLSSFRFSTGVGYAMLIKDFAWSEDETLGLGRFSQYIVPVVGLHYPVGDVILKLDIRAFVGTSFDRFLFAVSPGMLVPIL